MGRLVAIQFFIADSLGEIGAQSTFVTLNEDVACELHELAQRHSLDDAGLSTIDPYEITVIAPDQVMRLREVCRQLLAVDTDNSPTGDFLAALLKLCVAAIGTRRSLLAVGD